MTMRRAITGVSALLLLSGCSTFSFAPPPVETERKLTRQDRNFCEFVADDGAEMISRDVDGALTLINQFLVSYRCATHQAADGRQIFEVPSLLALAVAAVGPEFGLTGNGRLAAASGAALYTQSNSYYAPREKATILDSALDAVVCIKTEAVGVGFLDTRAKADQNNEIREISDAIDQAEEDETEIEDDVAQLEGELASKMDLPTETKSALIAQVSSLRSDLAAAKGRTRRLKAAYAEKLLTRSAQEDALQIRKDLPNGTIYVDVPRQYYELIAGSLFSVERILAGRLNSIQTSDASAIAAQIELLNAEQQENENDQNAVANASVDTSQTTAKMLQTDGTLSFDGDEEKNAQLVALQMDGLKTKMQQCVVRAKL